MGEKARDEIIGLKKKCVRCPNPATRQTARGQYAEENGHLPVNHGYFCDRCYDEGLKLEHDAMYG